MPTLTMVKIVPKKSHFSTLDTLVITHFWPTVREKNLVVFLLDAPTVHCPKNFRPDNNLRRIFYHCPRGAPPGQKITLAGQEISSSSIMMTRSDESTLRPKTKQQVMQF